MATNSPLQGVPLPEVTDADNVPYDLGNAVNFIEGRLVMRFESASDRAATIPNPVDGMVTWLRSVKRLEVYDGTAWRWVPPALATENYWVTGPAAQTFTATTYTTVAGAAVTINKVDPSTRLLIRLCILGLTTNASYTISGGVQIGGTDYTIAHGYANAASQLVAVIGERPFNIAGSGALNVTARIRLNSAGQTFTLQTSSAVNLTVQEVA